MLLADKYHGGIPTDRLRQLDPYRPPPHPGVMKPTIFTRFHSATVGMMALLGAKFGMSMVASSWLIRKTGSNNNGGTSQTVLATGTDGVTAGTNTLTAASNPFLVGMVNQGIAINVGGGGFVYRIVTGFNNSGSITFSGATIAAHSGQTYNVGGAWLTLNQALVTTNSVAAGDSIYLGAGVYRETTANAKSGTTGNVISVIGDVDGAQTSDAGEVMVTAYTTNDKTAPSSSVLLALAATTFLSFSFLTWIGPSGNRVASCTAGGHDFTFSDCTFNALAATATAAASFLFTSSTTGLALNVTMDRCTVLSGNGACVGFSLAQTASGSADWDAVCVIRNSLLFCSGPTGSNTGASITVQSSGSTTFKGGGVRAYNCTLIGAVGMQTTTATGTSTTVPCEIHNSAIVAGAVGVSAATSGQLTEDHNIINAPTARTNVTAGTGSISDGSYAMLVELGQSYKWGAGTIRQFMAPDGAGSPLLGFGSGGSPAVTVDWQNRPRPSGGGSASNGVGYMELHNASVQDTSTVPSGQTSAGKLTGPGDQDILIPVDATSTVISLQVEMSSGYGGTNYASATLLAEGELGVTTQTETCSSTLSAFQTLTFSSFTPSKAGWVRIRITSFDTSGTANVWFGAVT